MKVIFINRFFYPDSSATSQILSDLAFDLVENGFDIHVITSRLHYNAGTDELPVYEVINGVKVHRIRSTGFGRGRLLGRVFDYLSFYFFMICKLWELARKGDIIVAKTDPPLLSIVVSPVAWIKRCRQVNWLQDIFPEVAQKLRVGGYMMRWVYYLLRILRNHSLRRADINIVLGQRMQDYLVSEGIPQDRCYVIPNWADGRDIFPLDHHNNPLRQEWGLSDKFVIGYSGNFGRAHDFSTILSSAEKLARMNEGQDVVFLLIGAGAQLEHVQSVIDKRGLSNIRLQPYQPRQMLAQSLSVPDIHLVSLNNELEGFIVPSKFYGIAAAGRMTLFIGAQSGEIPSIIRKHEIGLTVSEGDAGRLVFEILQYNADRSKCIDAGLRARSVFDMQFDRAISVRKWEVLLANLGGG
ncbi:MAG: glycosyltransferase family 4 protein [Methyloligellaceae bacterium]